MIAHEDINDGKFYQKIHKTELICCCGFCNGIACNFLFHPCRKAVSTKKHRYQKNGFDLDLVYLNDRLIIHGFPAVGIEFIYRNPRYEIKRLLDTYHGKKYKVYNFCCEPGKMHSYIDFQ